MRVRSIATSAAVAALALTAVGLAAAAPTVEGEQLTVARASGRVAVETGRSGGRVLHLTGPGAARTVLTTAGPARLRVSVRAAGCLGSPRLVATVDGKAMLGVRITGRRWRTLTSGVVAAGTHRVAIRLANQAAGRCRRALRIDRVWLAPIAPTAPGPPTTAPPPGHAGATPPPAGGWWRPARATTWQWQLSGAVDQAPAADMYDIDLFDNSAAVVASLHAKGRRVVCYLSAGSVENGRPDTADFPPAVVGNVLDGWPDERWLDIRRIDVIGPIMEKRLDQCRAKGFDGVEPDNTEAYNANSGFPLTAAHQLAFNRFLANAAHARGLAIGLKNDLEQVAALAPSFDFAVNEQCFQYNECAMLKPFLDAGKPVFNTEYSLTTAAFCAKANAMGIMAMRKKLALNAYREVCW